MPRKTRNNQPLVYEVDFQTGELRLVNPSPDRPYDPPPKAKPETPGQVADRLRRQRRHLIEERLTHLKNMAAKSASEEERCLRSYRELGQFEGADPYQAALYAKAQEWRTSAKVYAQRAARIERWLQRP